MLAEKIIQLNEAILQCLNETNEREIVRAFAEVSIKITEADFGFVWLKPSANENFELVYKSSNLPYEPKLPRENGKNLNALTSLKPQFVGLVEKREDEYDISPYMQSFVIIPIAYKNEVYGNIVICFKDQQDFSGAEQSLYTFIGNAAAQAITINRLVQSEQQARVAAENQEAHFRALIENSYDLITLLDAQGVILDVTHSVTKVAGYDINDMLGRNIAEFIHQDDIPSMRAHMENALQKPGNPDTVEFRYRHKDGSWRWMESVGVSMLTKPDARAIVANIRDITARKQAQNVLYHHALHDSLTGLPNRLQFEGRFDQALQAAKRNNRQLALMFLDMDRFKNINDALGHSVGDTMLIVAATRFSSCLRAEDTVVRFGGDEFLILVNEVKSPKDASLVADKILKAVALPVKIGEHTIHPAVSIGIAMFPADGLDQRTLKKNADLALYRAKESGRNGYCFYDHSMDNFHKTEKMILENELRDALEYGQITVYYQPIINIKTKRVTAVEALARWRHPDRGLLPPAEFVPLAEEAGLIAALDKHVMTLALRQIKQWQNMGLPKFRVAVNLSAQQFSHVDMISGVTAILKECEAEPENLEFEITESLAMGNLELTGSNLKVLKKLGIHITIDDFGTGYSSLSYLKRFPVNSLKIDKSFVRHCITNPQDTSIARTIIVMAHALNLKVIAEGVETEQQLDFLASLGCDAAQGFYIHTPMEADKLAVWMGEKNITPQVMPVSL